MTRTEEHKKFACKRLFMFLDREIANGDPLTETEWKWFEEEAKVRGLSLPPRTSLKSIPRKEK